MIKILGTDNIAIVNLIFTHKGTNKSITKSKDEYRISSSYFLFGRTTAERRVS